MKNLIEVAQEFNLFTAENIPATHQEYFDTMNPYKHNKPIENFVYSDKYETGIFYKCLQDTRHNGEIYYYIDHSYFLIKPKNNDLFFVFTSHKKMHSLYPYYGLMRKIESVEFYKRYEAVKNLKEPNSIGVFTEKKVLDWLNYSVEWFNILTSLYDEVTGQNDANLQEIKNFSKECGGMLRSYKDVHTVETSLFDVTFKISKSSSYMSKEIRFKGGLSDIIKISK